MQIQNTTTKQLVWVQDYPEAQDKINYYNSIIAELQGYESAAYTACNSIRQEAQRTNVEKTNKGAGPYFDVFIMQKEKWFDDLAQMKGDLSSSIGQITKKISDAIILRDEWVRKSKLGHYE